MKINKLLIFVLIVFLIATVIFVGCNKKSAKKTQEETITPSGSIIYDNEIAEEKFLKERISDATAIYYKSSANGEFGDDRYLFEKTLLPSAYTELDYIQSTGSQCIDTGIKYSDTLTFDLKFSDYTNAANTGGIFGTEGWMFSLTRYQPTKLIWCTEQKKYFSYNSFSPYKAYTVQCGKEFMTINDTETISVNSSGIFGTQNITLFKSNTGYASVKIYYFKIYDGKTLLRNYIPCYRNYDKAVGLYDLVSKRFYCNSTENNFEQGNTISNELPNGYQQVEFIESTGTQRIKLDVVPKSTYKIESTFAITSKASNSTIWCARGETQAINTTTAFYIANEGLRCDYGVDKTSIMTPDIDLDTRHTLVMNSNTWSLDDSVVATMDYDMFDAGSQIGLFASHYNGMDFDVDNWSKMKLYGFKVYNEFRTLILNLIPCYRTADQLAGLYDIVNHKFYTNDGTGEFIIGSYAGDKESAIPSAYQAVEYILSSGTQYINTNYYWQSETTKIEADFEIISNSNTQSLWGNEEYYDGSSRYFSGIPHLGNNGLYGYFLGIAKVTEISIPIGLRTKIVTSTTNNKKYTIEKDGETIVNNASYEGTCQTHAVPNETTNIGKIYIFANHNSGSDGQKANATQIIDSMKLYRFKMYDNDIIVRDFIPCYRISDNVAGLYDKVNDAFYPNDGSGKFNVGDPVYASNDNDSLLPKAYQQLDYIKSTGTQYIDTNFVPDQNTGIEIKFSSNSYTDESLFVYGSGNSCDDAAFELYPWGNRLQFNYGTSDLFSDIEFDSNSIVTAYQKKDQVGYSVDGVSAYLETHSSNSFASPYTLYLLALHRATTGVSTAEVNLYSCKIWDNGNLVRDFIPCYRKADNVVGLYDLVNGVFYTNSSTGAFCMGNPVYDTSSNEDMLPDEYEKVDYLQSFGNGGNQTSTGQEIALGFPLDMENDWVEITFQSTMVDQNGLILATRGTLGNVAVSNYAYFYHYIAGPATCLYIGQENELKLIGSIDCDLAKHTMVWKNKQLIMDGVALGTDDRTLGTTDYDAYLFSWGGQYHYSGKMYSCRIWKSGQLFRDFVPCYRKTDSEPGMYDLVNGVFYTNSGTGSFAAGKNAESLIPGSTISQVKYLEEYDQLKYLTSAGEQYIDTGIIPSDDVAFEVAFGTDNLLIPNAYVMGNGETGLEIYLETGTWKVTFGSESATFEAIPTTKTTISFARKMLFVSYDDSAPTIVQVFTSTLESTRNLTLFATNRESDMILSSGINIYGFRMLSGTSMCECIPSIQKEDGAYGLYDGVQDKFLQSNGTAEFIPSQEILSRLLPDGYHILEYVEGFGNQYINTGIKDSNNTLFEIDTLVPSLTSAIGTTTGMNITYNTTYPGGYFYYLNRTGGAQGKATINKRTLFKMNNNLAYRDDSLVHTFTAVTKTDTQSMFLFGRNKGGILDDAGETKIYSCKIYESKMLVRYYIPACRNVDGEIGFYDLVTATFYTNEGEGNFSSNETENAYTGIVLPSGYRQVEYIEGTGTQYFDTGILINKPDILDYKIKMQYTSTAKLWCGANPYLQATYEYFKTREILNLHFVYDGVSEYIYTGEYLTKTIDWSQYDYPNTHVMIFALGNENETVYNAAPQPARVYSARLLKNNELVLDYVPCYRESDGEAGFYDLVSQKFIRNSGTGNAKVGKEVHNVSNSYEQVDYIEYTGTQQIVIPHNVTSSTEVEVTLANNADNSNTYSIVDMGDATLKVINNIPTYNVFDATITGSTFTTNTLYTLVTSFDKDYALTINEDVLDTENITLGTFANSIKLFGNATSLHGTIKLYRIKVYEGVNLIYDFIPTVRKHDGKIGLYEYVNDDFYIPEEGDMECNVSFEQERIRNLYDSLDYIFLDDEHHLDLSYIGNIKFIFDAQFDVSSSNGIMGYTKMRDVNWGVKNGKYVLGAIGQYTAGNRDIIIDEYTTSSIIRSLNGEVIANVPSTIKSRGTYRIGNAYDAYDENCCVKIYSVKIEQDGVLIAELVPARRKSDQSLGFLDKVSDVFYVVYNNKNNFVMGNIVGHYFDTNNVVTEVSESHSGDISHICSICGTEIHETQDALAYKVNFTYGTGVKEIRVFKGYDLSSYETIDTAYSRNKNTNNYSRRKGQVYFEIVLDEGYEIEKIYPGDAACTNHENNIYIISDITSETTVKILARKHVQE